MSGEQKEYEGKLVNAYIDTDDEWKVKIASHPLNPKADEE